MKSFRFLAIAVFFGAFLAAATPTQASAQLNITVGIGTAPLCPYGYFNYAPYPCAPFGYYGPQWYTNGIFLGAGPWFHGPVGFRGYVNHDYDPHYGYRGPLPRRGEHADWGRHNGWDKHFRGNEYHSEYRHDNGNHNGGHDNGHGNGHDRGHGHDNDHGHGH